MWYRFTVQESGDLVLSIDPNAPTDDYDWVLYDMTFKRCEDIYTQSSQMQVSCNAAGGLAYQGETGISSSNGGNTNCSVCGATNKWNMDLPVQAGKSYVLSINNWAGAGAQSGFTLDFSASTAVIYDDVRPEIQNALYNNIICGDSVFAFNFTEVVKCATVTVNALKFTGPDGEHDLVNVTGPACEVGAEMEQTYELTIDPPFTVNGDYTLEIRPFSNISDACDNIALPQQITFTVDLGAPEIDETSMQINAATCGQDNGSITDLEISGNGPFEYYWVNAAGDTIATTVDLTDVSSGQYTLYVSDPAGCSSAGGPYTVPDEGAPQLDETSMQISDNTCDAVNGAITGLEVNGVEPFDFIWTDDNSQVVGNNLDLTGVAGGQYFLQIIDNNGCESFAGPYSIEDLPAPLIDDQNAFTSGENCDMANGAVYDVFVTGSTQLEYRWYSVPGDTVSTEIPLTGVVAGDYYLLVRDENGCESVSGPYEVLAVPGPQIDNSMLDVQDASCGLPNGSITGLEITGQSGLTYQWLDENNNPVGDTSFVTGLDPGTYTLIVTDDAGCESTAGPYTLTNVGGIQIETLEFNNATCELANGEIMVHTLGSPGNNEFSVDGMNWLADSVFNTLMPGSYTVYARDENGCVAEYSGNPVVIENDGDAIEVTAEGDNPVCTGDDLQLSILESYPDASFSWSGPNGFSSQESSPVVQNVSLTDAGTYTVIVENPPYGCLDTSEVLIDVVETFAMQVDVTASKNPIYPSEEVTFYATGSHGSAEVYYVWYINGTQVQSGPDSTLVTTEVVESSTVYCEMHTDAGCADPNPAFSNEFDIKVYDILFYLPNSFNPASTQGNEKFRIITNVDAIPGLEFYVFDRWGQKIFETNDKDEGWDGKIKGEPAPEGVYVWLVNYEVFTDDSPDGKVETKKGTVTLVR
ncbi:MAG: gliding motility-associated C-terminal domain-containing protein [Bacteroidota bacterium]|nr:gliding motility-associated C-terminal domain-containing protein [Bacteroidota bacterium]